MRLWLWLWLWWMWFDGVVVWSVGMGVVVLVVV